MTFENILVIFLFFGKIFHGHLYYIYMYIILVYIYKKLRFAHNNFSLNRLLKHIANRTFTII